MHYNKWLGIMILDEFLGKNDRIEILEAFLDNENYELSLDEIIKKCNIPNPVYHINTLEGIGILIQTNYNSWKLNRNDRRVICLSLIEIEEYSRRIDELNIQKEMFTETYSSRYDWSDRRTIQHEQIHKRI